MTIGDPQMWWWMQRIGPSCSMCCAYGRCNCQRMFYGTCALDAAEGIALPAVDDVDPPTIVRGEE